MGSVIGAWDAFQAERSVTLAPTSLRSDYKQVRRWLDRCPVTELERGREVMAWVLAQQPPKAARRVGMYVKSLYRWASEEDVALVPRSPVASFRFPKRLSAGGDVVVIPAAERRELLVALEPRVRSTRPWCVVAAFMLQTALRTGEAFGLQWRDVAEGAVLVHQNMTLSDGLRGATKTGRQRVVPLNTTAQRLLAQVPQGAEDAFVFPWSREAFQSFFRYRVVEAVGAGKLGRLYRPYDLRHTAISAWLEAGIPVAQAAAWAGNSAQVIWRHYAATTQKYEVPEL